MSDEDTEGPRVLDAYDFANRVGGGVNPDDVKHWTRDGYIPTVTLFMPDGRAREVYLPATPDDFIREYLTTGLARILDALSATPRQALLKAKRQRKLAAHVVQRLGWILQYDPGRLDEAALRLLDDDETIRFKVGVGGLDEIEIVRLWSWVSSHRNRAYARLARNGRRHGPEELAQAGHDIIALDDWRDLLEPRLKDGVVWLAAAHDFHLPVRKGSDETIRVYGPSLPGFVDSTQSYGWGLTPVARTLLDEALAESARLQRAMNEGKLRIVEAPASR